MKRGCEFSYLADSTKLLKFTTYFEKINKNNMIKIMTPKLLRGFSRAVGRGGQVRPYAGPRRAVPRPHSLTVASGLNQVFNYG